MKRTLTVKTRAVPEAHDFRSFLRERFRAAARRNPRFSLRSFARQLGVDHSTLSQILRNRRVLSPRTIEAIGRRIGLTDEVIQHYKEGIARTSHQRRTGAKGLPDANVQRFQVDFDTFQLLSGWQHQAILELTHTRDFRADSRWIAQRLKLPIADINIALQRLLRLGLLEMKSESEWLDKSGDAEFHTKDLTVTAANRIDQEVHRLAFEAAGEVRAESRIQAGMIIAVNSKKIPALRKLAEEFIDEARALLSVDDRTDDVYQVEVSMFPLTRLQEEEGDTDG